METKIRAKIIEEMVGSPKEHIETTFNDLLEKIKKEFEVVEETINEPEEIKGMWSTFVELEINFNDMNQLTGFCFDFMPSSVEIISPKELTVEHNDINNLLNDILAKLHQYSMLLKNTIAENKILKKKLS